MKSDIDAKKCQTSEPPENQTSDTQKNRLQSRQKIRHKMSMKMKMKMKITSEKVDRQI